MKITQIFQKMKSILGLSLSIAKANFKVKNEGSLLGILWYLLDPILFFVVILFVKGAISNSIIEKYPAYLFIGLILFNLFSSSTNSAIKSIQGNANLIKSTRINREVFVISNVIETIFEHFFELLILISILIFLKINLIGLIFYPIIFIFYIFFITGFSFILSVLGVYINDLKNIWPVITRILWFVTPIFYNIKVEDYTMKIIGLNPIYYFIETVREILIYNNIPSIKNILIITIPSILILIIGIVFFEKNKDNLAEKL